MDKPRAIAYALIAIGAVGLLTRLSADAGWLWIGLVAVGLLAAYARTRTYAFLVLGALLAGLSLGILLEGNWNWPGAFLVSLGVATAAIDLVEPRANRWPRWLGGLLALLGVVSALDQAGVFGSSVVAVLLIVAGALLVWRGRNPGATPPHGARRAGTPAPASPAAVSATLRPEPPAPPPEARPETGSAPTAPHPGHPVAGTSPAVGTAGPPPPPGEAARLDALRDWRRRTAAEEGRAEALVLSDATLEELAARRPATLDALRDVWGIGPVKSQRYGEALLELSRRG